MTTVTLLTQEACASCVQAKEVLSRIAGEHPLLVQEIRLDSPEGAALAAEHAVLFAPGVLVDGEMFSYGRLSEKKLRRRLSKPAPNSAA